MRVRTPPAHAPPDTGYADHRTAEHSTAQQPGPSEASIHKATSRATTNAHTTTTSYQPQTQQGGPTTAKGGTQPHRTPRQARSLLPRVHPAAWCHRPPRRQVSDGGLRRHPVEPDRATQAHNRWNALVRRPQSIAAPHPCIGAHRVSECIQRSY